MIYHNTNTLNKKNALLLQEELRMTYLQRTQANAHNIMITIGIAGGTGSGKSTVVRKIIERLPPNEVVLLPQDSYYRDSAHIPQEERLNINFDHPESIEFDLLTRHLKTLKQGRSINQPIYSYVSCTRSNETITIFPREVIIIEGILVLTNPELRQQMDLKVFVDTDADDRLIRVIKRDMKERGRDVPTIIERYQRTVKPMHEQFIEPTKRFADLIVPQGGNNEIAIDILTMFIQNNLGTKLS